MRALYSCLVVALLFVSSAVRADSSYAFATPIDLAALLPPPPAPGTAAGDADLAAVLALQRARTADGAAKAKADAEATVFRYADVLGPNFRTERLPLTTKLFQDAARAIGPVVNPAKERWNRPRPFLVSKEIEPAIARPDGASYPSGHGAFARLTAILLATMLPDRSAAIHARGAEFSHNRIVAGVHYPTDLVTGEIAGTLIAERLLQDRAFRRDLDAARAELVAVLASPEPAAAQAAAAH